jgi:hypothetical protein
MRAHVCATVVSAVILLASTARADDPQGCREHFDGTFAMVQSIIFERHGCTSAACHGGADPAGGLDLTASASYDALIDQPPHSIAAEQFPGLARVVPGNKRRSLLWLNVAAATLPALWTAPLRAMPLGGLPPLTIDELELLRLWIENGAPRDGVVPGTAALFDACLPPLTPLTVTPLAPPPAGVGVQIRAPHQVLPPRRERETCFVSYYDVTDQVPPEFRGPGNDTFRFKRVDARQDPLSHHAVVIVYTGRAAIDDPSWGPFACRGGDRDGQPCVPTARDACGADAICASPPVPSVACIGFGPGDAGIGTGETTLFSTMGTALASSDGIYDEAPLRGILVWNSHAFNVTDTPGALDMWINFTFAAPDEQRTPLRRFVDISAIAAMHVPPFETQEICQHHTLAAATRVIDLTSHTHWRGKRFRVFDGRFACDGGPNAGAACSPFGPDPGLASPDLCRGFPCRSRRPPRAGDCDGDLTVSIDELVTGVRLALEGGAAGCPRFDADGNGRVTIDELLAAVAAAIGPVFRDPDESLLYTSTTYADPLVLSFAPPRLFGTLHATPEERTLTYCALYDNGFTNPDDVKRNSRAPNNAARCSPTRCAAGVVGTPCQRDLDCDSAAGAGDGACDACTLTFGVSTDDEMFVLIGSYTADAQ